MPGRNIVRIHLEDSYYHVYNRGVDRRLLFQEPRDYKFFTSLLKAYSTPQIVGLPNRSSTWWRSKLLPGEISVMAYCLMPNHFHLLLHQQTANGITRFMRRVMTAYVRRFNNRYERCGSLFEGKYKVALIDNSDYLLFLSRYIHRNPLPLIAGGAYSSLSEYPYSSFREYFGLETSGWEKNGRVMEVFGFDNAGEISRGECYRTFIEAETYHSEPDISDFLLDL